MRGRGELRTLSGSATRRRSASDWERSSASASVARSATECSSAAEGEAIKPRSKKACMNDPQAGRESRDRSADRKEADRTRSRARIAILTTRCAARHHEKGENL